MTVLETEEDADERPVPPRKKLCLSLSSSTTRSIPASTKSWFEPVDPEDLHTTGNNCKTSSFSFGFNKMLNGHKQFINSHQDSNCDTMTNAGSDGPRIATLCNLGNTCFLNSVLYTLRFAPSFLHNLHHLATDLANFTDKQQLTKIKSSSLGRTGVSLSTNSNRSWSSKDLTLTTGNPIADSSKPRIQVATEKLHELFIAMRASEMRENGEPYQPDAFLQALREVNPIFEGNQQQDAHELLVCLLDNIRETFQLLVKQRENQIGHRINGLPTNSMDQTSEVQSDGGRRAPSKRSTRGMVWKKKKSPVRAASTTNIGKVNGVSSSKTPLENGYSETSPIVNGDSLSGLRLESKNCFISEDFEGVSLLRTTCLECEHVTERKETFCDICVPIETDRSNERSNDRSNERDEETQDEIDYESEIYRRAVVTSEFLGGRDKYWCSCCLRYNEARRAVCFPSLPRLLVLQLKRFSTTAGSMEKINNHMPTPQKLRCFCEECNQSQQRGPPGPKRESRHEYKLCSVIMHQGATMTAGHYVAYTKLPGESNYADYFHCDRDVKKQLNHSTQTNNSDNNRSQNSILKYFRSKSTVNESKEQSVKTGCRSMECCGLRHSGKNAGAEDVWLECDDEIVRVIQTEELMDKLAANPRNSATPYLLFYVKSTTPTATTTATSPPASKV